MVVPGMHENSVQSIIGRIVGVRFLQVRVQRDLLVKLEPVVELDGTVGYRIVLETHKVQVQYWRERGEYDSLLGVLQAVFASVVFVVAVQRLLCYVVLERLVDWEKRITSGILQSVVKILETKFVLQILLQQIQIKIDTLE